MFIRHSIVVPDARLLNMMFRTALKGVEPNNQLPITETLMNIDISNFSISQKQCLDLQ